MVLMLSDDVGKEVALSRCQFANCMGDLTGRWAARNDTTVPKVLRMKQADFETNLEAFLSRGQQLVNATLKGIEVKGSRFEGLPWAMEDC